MGNFGIDLKRRQLMLAALAAGTLTPWEFARAQGTSGDTLNIAYISDVPTWDPTAVTVPQA